MPRKKLEITATEEEIQKLLDALATGSPLLIALQYSGISQSTYFYWVAMYSVVAESKAEEEMKEMDATKYGVSIDNINDVVAAESPGKKTALGAYIEPSQESLLQYKNNVTFHRFADKCYEIIKRCNEQRAAAAIGHLEMIVKSTKNKNLNASGSMWFLERTLSDFFGKPSERVKEEENNKPSVEKVVVEYIDPNTKDNRDRIKEMDELIINETDTNGVS